MSPGQRCVASLSIATSVALAGCPGDLENPERFALGQEDGGGRDGGAADDDGGGQPAVCPDYDVYEDLLRSTSCVGCHNGTLYAGTTNFMEHATVEDFVAAYVDERPVYADTTTCESYVLDSENPEASLLYVKLLGEQPEECGDDMPLGGLGGIEDEQLECVRLWLHAVLADATPTSDGGVPDSDSGVPAADGGTGEMDGGVSPMDSGTTPADSGVPTDSGMPGSATRIWIEAEAATMPYAAPWTRRDNAGASGGAVMASGAFGAIMNTPTEGLRYTFEVTTPGMYKFWARVRCPSNNENSFWVRVDGAAEWERWNNDGTDLTAFGWEDIHDADGVVITRMLSAGSHTLDIAAREQNTVMDRVLVTSELDYTPMGLGE